MIRVKRVYEAPQASDGRRFLVERLWPRGIKKECLQMDGWLKDLGASTELRRWFGHDPARWKEFQRRYIAELNAHPAACQPVRDAARRGNVTLLYSARDPEHNNAVALKAFLETESDGRSC